MAIRAYLDTNLYISFLLSPDSAQPPSTIVRAGLRSEFGLLFGDPTVEEILNKTATKPYLIERITSVQIETLLQIMKLAGEHIELGTTVIPAVGRDRKDDYLLAYSTAGNATHLVTGDKDLLVLGQVEDVRIIAPAAFLDILDQTNR